jgi:hypothetical protein
MAVDLGDKKRAIHVKMVLRMRVRGLGKPRQLLEPRSHDCEKGMLQKRQSTLLFYEHDAKRTLEAARALSLSKTKHKQETTENRACT